MIRIKLCFIIFVFVALYSCRDVAEEPESEKYNINLIVDAKEIYEKFENISDSISSYLNNNQDKKLYITTLLYNSEGFLIDSISSYSDNFTDVSQKFINVEKGNYTLLTLETIIDINNGCNSEYWDLLNIKDLNYASIVAKKCAVPYTGVIGLTESYINLDKEVSSKIIPKPLGCLIYTTWDGFGRTDFDLLALYQKNQVVSYLMNPSLKIAERFQKNNSNSTWVPAGYVDKLNKQSKIWFVLGASDMSFSWGFVEDDSLLVNPFTLYPSNNNEFHYTLNFGDTYYAYCRFNPLTGGDIFWGTKQDQTIWLENIGDLPFYFKEPYRKLGTDINSVLQSMSKFEGQTTPIDIDDDYYYITYYDICSIDRLEYWFSDILDGLYLINLYFNKTVVKKEDIELFLKELGYTPWRFTPNGCNYVSNDTSIRLFLTETESEWLVQYY